MEIRVVFENTMEYFNLTLQYSQFFQNISK